MGHRLLIMHDANKELIRSGALFHPTAPMAQNSWMKISGRILPLVFASIVAAVPFVHC
jgi:hypothetical protein